MSSLNVDKLNVSVGIELPSYTSNNRPTGSVGLMIFNSTSGTVEIYDGNSWISTGQGGIEATGGIVSVSGNFKMHAFTQPGTSTFQVTSVPAGTQAEVLVVAGGGGGGGSHGGAGGGGAGGVVHHTSYPIAVGSYNVVVGDGGVSGTGFNANSSNDSSSHGRPGGDSYFDQIHAIGGGGGNESFYYFSIYKNGGSGGGGGDMWPATRAGNVPGGRAWTGGNALQGNNAGGTYYGNYGGSRGTGGPGPSEDGGHSGPHEGAGGGGAGGTASGGSSNTASNGGIGIQLNQFSPYGFPSGWFAGGGGGGYFTSGGGSANRANNSTGGYYGGGGRGGSTGYSLYGEDAVNATGGGGGGGSSNNNGISNAGRGGSGIVIVRYQI